MNMGEDTIQPTAEHIHICVYTHTHTCTDIDEIYVCMYIYIKIYRGTLAEVHRDLYENVYYILTLFPIVNSWKLPKHT